MSIWKWRNSLDNSLGSTLWLDVLDNYSTMDGLGKIGCESFADAIRDVRRSITDATGVVSA